jgi:hypothetical protein
MYQLTGGSAGSPVLCESQLGMALASRLLRAAGMAYIVRQFLDGYVNHCDGTFAEAHEERGSIDVQSLDAIQSQTRIQAGEATTADQFGLDVEQDMLKAIVGAPKNPKLGSRMAGSDPLSVSVKLSLSDLPHLLAAYRVKFETDLSGADYEWVNNISVVKSTTPLTLISVDPPALNKFDPLSN